MLFLQALVIFDCSKIKNKLFTNNLSKDAYMITEFSTYIIIHYNNIHATC